MSEQRLIVYESITEAATRTKLPRSWFYDRTRRNLIPVARRAGKYIRFIPAELDAWIKAGCPEQWGTGGAGDARN